MASTLHNKRVDMVVFTHQVRQTTVLAANTIRRINQSFRPCNLTRKDPICFNTQALDTDLPTMASLHHIISLFVFTYNICPQRAIIFENTRTSTT